jgi:D-3-phosphoglycerate dehydrogenase
MADRHQGDTAPPSSNRWNIVHTVALPGQDLGEDLLADLNVHLVKSILHTEEELIAQCAHAHAVLGDIAHRPFTRRVMSEWKNCRILAGCISGYDSVDLSAASDLGIVVTNVPDYCLDEVSGRTIALMLALAYKIIPANEAVKKEQRSMIPNHDMLEVIHPVFRMRGQTLGLIGCSKIGTATALKAKGLGLRVIAYDPYVFTGVLESLGIEPVDFDTLLSESDFVSVHVPATPETENLLSRSEFSKMKKTAYLINAARGTVVDEEALAWALERGLLAGAGLDVTRNEPIEKDNPLLQMPNVIFTGHSAFYSVQAENELFRKPMAQVVMALNGRWPTYALNPDVKNTWLERWGSGS